MKPPADRLFQLLPAHYRDLDVREGGNALRDLLRVLEEQFDVVEDEIARMYDDWFIETCADWVVPYLGDLAGWQPVQGSGGEWPAPRRDVANTLRHRRRKGTLPLLVELARDVAGWPALAVEAGFQSSIVGGTGEIHGHRSSAISPQAGPAPLVDMHDPARLAWLDTPFDTLAHTIDVRAGGVNLPTVSLHVWRLRAFPITRTPAGDNTSDRETFRFSALGNDAPLFRPDSPVPRPLTRMEIRERAYGDGPPWRVSADFYGPGKSFEIYAPDWPEAGAPQPVPRERIIPADLSGWNPVALPPEGFIAVDPQLGRLAFPEGRGPDPEKGVELTWHAGFSAAMGGGEYHRPLAQMEDATVYRLGRGATLQDGLNRWAAERDTTHNAVIEFEHSGIYNGLAHIKLKNRETLQIRAAQGVRPILQLRKPTGHGAGTLLVELKPGAQLVLDGIIISDGSLLLRDISGGRVNFPGNPADAPDCPALVVIRHSTLVPGWSFNPDCCVEHPDKDSIELERYTGRLAISKSITGSISVNADEAGADPAIVEICDSIVDATSRKRPAIYDNNYSPAAEDENPWAHISLTLRRSTIFGTVSIHMLPLAENSLFCGTLRVARRQPGCLRFCYVKSNGRTPRRYECQPEKAMGLTLAGCGCSHEGLTCSQADALRLVRPFFTSERFGDPGYAQLGAHTPDEIRRGADDRSEMGAFHDLFQAHRQANLRTRLDEFTPAGCQPALVFQT